MGQCRWICFIILLATRKVKTVVTCWQRCTEVIPQASRHVHSRGGEGSGRNQLGVQSQLECYVSKCEGVLKRHPATTSITLVTYTEHLKANVNTILTPRLKLITATTAPPVSSQMCPLNYFSRSGNGFMLSHSSFYFIQWLWTCTLKPALSGTSYVTLGKLLKNSPWLRFPIYEMVVITLANP